MHNVYVLNVCSCICIKFHLGSGGGTGVFVYLEVKHHNFTDPPQGEEPHVEVQTHLEWETGHHFSASEKESKPKQKSKSRWNSCRWTPTEAQRLLEWKWMGLFASQQQKMYLLRSKCLPWSSVVSSVLLGSLNTFREKSSRRFLTGCGRSISYAETAASAASTPHYTQTLALFLRGRHAHLAIFTEISHGDVFRLLWRHDCCMFYNNPMFTLWCMFTHVSTF